MKRQIIVLVIVVLAAYCLSLYDENGRFYQTTENVVAKQSAAAGQTEVPRQESAPEQSETQETKADMEQDELQRRMIQENKQAQAAQVSNPDIRVLICSDNYESEYHETLTVRATVPFTIAYGDTKEDFEAGEELSLDMESPYLQEGNATLTLLEEGVFQLPFLKRSQDCPSYEGSLSVEKREEGLLVVNTLPLETYLCYVVPSEMPSSYPMEALKAQAVCARGYAYRQIEGNRCEEFGADLDDSVSYQVYNNIQATAKARQAVEETKGLLMMENGEIEDALYYSTSCGIRIEDDMSEEAVFCSFISGDEPAYEEEEPWYRWETVFSMENMNALAENSYPGQIGTVASISVEKRSSSGRAEILKVTGDLGEVIVEGEYQIRKFLQPYNTTVYRQDGSEAPDVGLLPSAFFYVTPLYEGDTLSGFQLNGGGYGHGNGMSQNGAKHMAAAGKTYLEILKYYYGDGVELACAE